MEPTPSQLSRKKDIKNFLNEKTEGIQSVYEANDYLQSQEQLRKMEHFGENEANKSFAFREDAAELGQKKTWKPNDFEKKKNKKIEESKKLTSKATADTLELYKAMQERKKDKLEQEMRETLMPKPTEEEIQKKAFAMIDQLKSVRFEKRMLTTANVKMHFHEYMDMVDMYRELQNMARAEEFTLAHESEEIIRKYADNFEKMKSELALSQNKKPVLRPMLSSISGPMDILTDRMEHYLNRNRITLDGQILRETEKPQAFVYNQWVDDKFKNTDSRIQSKMVDTTKYDPEQLLESKNEILEKKVIYEGEEKSELEIVLQEKDQQLGEAEYPADMESFLQMNPVERVKNIRSMRRYLEQLKIVIADYEESIKHPPVQLHGADQVSAWKRGIGEELITGRRELVTMNAIIMLAEAEGQLLLAKNDEEQNACLAEMEDAWSDFARVQQRFLKEKQPLTGTYWLPVNFKKVTAKDAVNSDSDRANYSFKNKIMVVADGLRDGLFSTLAQKATAYASVTHYSTEPQEETRLLRELIVERRKWQVNVEAITEANDTQRAALKELDSLLKHLQKGESKNPIPDWDAIPESMKIDGIDQTKMPEGSTVARLTEKELSKVDKIPKETGAGKQQGSYRNQALVSMRKWVTLDPDTPLFSHEPTINDLRQGKVSNCYMVASTTGLINYDPQIIKDCIRDNGDGTVTVRLYAPSNTVGRDCVPRYIRIPKRIPKLMTGGDILTDGAIWMQLIERAAAQAGLFRQGRSGYQSLWYGRGDEWLTLLTGAAGNVLVNQASGTRMEGAETDDKVFEMLEQAEKSHYIFHAGTKSDASDGMNSGHAYTVLGVKTVGGQRFVTLRNPYANMSRTVSESGKITKSTDYFSSTPDDTYGQFDIPFEEFMKTMETISYTDMSKAFPTEQIEDKATNSMREKTLAEIAEEEKNKVVRKTTTDPLQKAKENKTEEKKEENKEENKEDKKEDKKDQNVNNGRNNNDDWDFEEIF